MKLIHILTLMLVVIGGLNWGLVGLMDLNLVTTIFGTGILTTFLYILVTVSTLYHVMPVLMKQLQTS